MANENLKEFSIQWILFGLLFFCLISFAISFSFYNNPNALGDSENVFESSQQAIGLKLIATEDSANLLLNITSETNPEVSDLGSRDSVATSYGTTGSAKGFFETTKIFMGWVLTGTSGQILISVFTGMFGLTALFFIIKSIRQGA